MMGTLERLAQTSSCSMAAARKVSAAQSRTVLVLAAEERGELAGGGGFAGAVDADHHDDFGRCGGRGVGAGDAVEDGFEFELEETAEFRAAVDSLAEGTLLEVLDDLGGGGGADV